MEGQELRGRYPLTDIWLRAVEWKDDQVVIRVGLVVTCIALNRTDLAMRLLALFAARVYR